MNAKFDKKFKEQSDQINNQRNEIISLRQANVSFLNAQSQWNRVVNELGEIKVVLTDVSSLLRKSESTAPTRISQEDAVFPIDNKSKNEEMCETLKDIDKLAEENSYSTRELQRMCAVTSINSLRDNSLIVQKSLHWRCGTTQWVG
ncbi:hypothetical protein MJO29_007097 [Puccinia striiformis f. sp. tritici]|nr:hypothetical protein MJO29_007097 [Puccinia striiformis f. sp. tritici]